MFGAGYPATRGNYPAGCDENAFLALFESGSPSSVAVDKQCNRCGPTGYYARISGFAAPLVGLITETCRQAASHQVRTNLVWNSPPHHTAPTYLVRIASPRPAHSQSDTDQQGFRWYTLISQ
jgi:hypothetical protein